MKVTLAQALPLRSTISKRIQDLLQERKKVAVVEAEKGEQYEAPVRKMEEVTEELRQAREDFRRLDVLVTAENLKATIQWDGKDISITEALELAKQTRGEAHEHKEFGNRNKKERKHSGGWGSNDSNIILHAQYDPENYRKSAQKLQREADRLSFEIERKNHTVEFDFPDAEKYI